MLQCFDLSLKFIKCCCLKLWKSKSFSGLYFPFPNSSLVNLYYLITKTRIPTIICWLCMITLMMFK